MSEKLKFVSFKNAFSWGIINNFTQLCFAFLFFVVLGEISTIQIFSQYIVLLAYINIAISLFEFRLQDVFLRDASLDFENMAKEYTSFVACECFVRVLAFSALSLPIAVLTGIKYEFVYIVGLSIIASKAYTGVTNAFVKTTVESWKVFLLICVDYISKLVTVYFIDEMSFDNITKIYLFSFLPLFITFFILFKKYFVLIELCQIISPIKRSFQFAKDNWKLSVVETGIRELDVIIIESLFSSVIVVTYKFAKLIAASAWRIVDSVLQIELIVLRQQRKLFRTNIFNIDALYIIISIIHILGMTVVIFVQKLGLAFNRLDDIAFYLALNVIWTFFGIFFYRDLVYLQHRERVDLIIKATLYSGLAYFITILLSYYTLDIILPASYTICMSFFFVLVGIFRRSLGNK